MPIRHGPALYLSAEEPDDELAIRLHAIAGGLIVPEGMPTHGLAVVSRAQVDSLLCTFTRAGVIEPTGLWKELAQRIGDTKPRLVCIDAAADVFGGDENERAQVRQFIALLRKPAIEHDCAIVLMGHPSRDGIRSGHGYSGSTAWHNGVRARQYLTTPQTEKGEEPDRSRRKLALHKSNSGETGHEIPLRWENGRFVVMREAESADRLAEAKELFIDRLRAYTAQGRHVSDKKGPSYAPAKFAADPAGKGFTSAIFARAMDALFDEEAIVAKTIDNGASPSKRPRGLVLK
jgi:RecA-family ATPase